MTIFYIRLNVAISGLKLKSEAEMENLREEIQAAIYDLPKISLAQCLDDAVEVKITEYAGLTNDNGVNVAVKGIDR
jgi:hypothetical protein